MQNRSVWLTGFVLAGGASRRMGSPKALLRLEDEAMLIRQLGVVQKVASRAVVIGSRPEYGNSFGFDFIPDALPGRGPLAGIATALRATRTEYNLFLGCDLPFVTARLLACLSERALETEADALLARSAEGRLQPLCAVYRRRARWAAQASLDAGENKVMSLYSKVRTIILPWRDLARAGFQPSVFANMNTPEDYEAAKRRLENQSRVTSDE